MRHAAESFNTIGPNSLTDIFGLLTVPMEFLPMPPHPGYNGYDGLACNVFCASKKYTK